MYDNKVICHDHVCDIFVKIGFEVILWIIYMIMRLCVTRTAIMRFLDNEDVDLVNFNGHEVMLK